MNFDQVIIITTINPPRKEIKAFSKIKNWHLISVGDKKTPLDWKANNVIYLSPQMQDGLFPNYSKVAPWNRFTRKNTGYLFAIKNKAKIIADTDDDVFPYKTYPHKLNSKKETIVLSGPKFINIYKFYLKKGTKKNLCWPRGFPLDYITSKEKIIQKKSKVFVPMQNSVIDKDSDFDAIYRLTNNTWVDFKKSGQYALGEGTYCPVNTQNTFTYPDVYPLLYLPTYANFHVDDIWRGYIAQRIMWEIDAHLLFTYPTAYTSDRNTHNYLKDFEIELPLFLQSNKLVALLDSLSLSKDISRSLLKVYREVVKAGILPKEELIVVTQWIREIEKLKYNELI